MFTPIAEKYQKEVLPKRSELFGIENIHATPRIEKVALNARVKRGGSVDAETIAGTLARITGQRPVATKARKSISNFKIRAGMVVGMMLTLRGARARAFLDKLIHIVLPRVRDFHGLDPKAFDKQGNYTIGLNEHIVFPEAAGDDMAKLHGLQIVIKTTAKNPKDAETLLRILGFPFKKK